MNEYSVYSAVFGRYDIVAKVEWFPPNSNLFLYSDSFHEPKGWALIRVTTPDDLTPELANRLAKTHPPKEVLSYPFICYVDGNIKLQTSIDDFFLQFRESGADVGFFRHPNRRTLREELEQCEKAGKVPLGAGSAQIQAYERDGFLGQVPLLEGSLFFRKNNVETGGMMALWSEEIWKWKTRDQLSLPYVIWKSGVRLHVFSGSPRRMYTRFVYTAHGGKSVFDLVLRAGALALARWPSALDALARLWRGFHPKRPFRPDNP